jgi:archaea-specific DNA-binding protein
MVEGEKFEKDSNVVYIGNKPPMNYVTAVLAIINSDQHDDVMLKARGNAISKAVDVAEITRNRFATYAQIKSIEIGTESLDREDGKSSNVSSIEICLTAKKQ